MKVLNLTEQEYQTILQALNIAGAKDEKFDNLLDKLTAQD